MSTNKTRASLFVVGPKDSGKKCLLNLLLIKLKSGGENNLSRFLKKQDTTNTPKDTLKDLVKHPLSSKYYFLSSSILYHNQSYEIVFNYIETENFTFDIFYQLNSLTKAISSFIMSDFIILTIPIDNPSSKEGYFSVRQSILLSKYFKKKMIICVTKMDIVDYSKSKFEKIERELIYLYNQFDISKEYYVILPISSVENVNVLKSEEINWWKGKSLIEYLDDLKNFQLEYNTKGDLKISVIRYYSLYFGYRINGYIYGAKILSGTVQKNQKVYDNDRECKIYNIETHRNEIYSCDNGLLGLAISKKLNLKKGSLLTDKPEEKCHQFIALVDIYNCKHKIKEGFTCTFHFHASKVPCRLIEINYEIDNKTKERKTKNPKEMEKEKSYIATYQSEGTLQIDPEIDSLSNFCFRTDDKIIGFGKVLRAVSKKFYEKLLNIKQNDNTKNIYFSFE